MTSSREYDPEIKDIADYVANKTIDSELAVSLLPLLRALPGLSGCPSFSNTKKTMAVFVSSPAIINWVLPRWLRENQKLARARGEEREKIQTLFQLLTVISIV
jgi:hypothetical protein